MLDKDKFLAQFRFDPQKTGFVGVEREQFVLNPETQRIIPASVRYLDCLKALGNAFNMSQFNFGYELSACQLESKIGPCQLSEIGRYLGDCDRILSSVDRELLLTRANWEIAPEDMPLDIYPDPTGRYQIITRDMPREILSAACRVAATHIHIGMPDLAIAITAYNNAVKHVDRLTKMGDNSGGKRMELYKLMAKRCSPLPINSPEEFFREAVAHGFVHDPRQCWTLIRISIHGTIEFRMFGATGSVEQITEWVHECHKLCF